MSNDKYNGWTNYETWNAHLWISNCEGTESHWREQAQAAWDDADTEDTMEDRENEAVNSLAKTLEESFDSDLADVLESAGVEASMWADLLGSSLGRVNWHELARHYVDDLDKE